MKSILRTEIEEVYGHSFTDKEWESVAALESLAGELANHCAITINEEAAKISREPLTYNEQWTLETLIAKLQAKV